MRASKFTSENLELTKPGVIHLQKNGNKELGYLAVLQESEIPFSIKRAYWIFGVPANVTRGYHAHKALWQALIAVEGRVDIKYDDGVGGKGIVRLHSPGEALILPPCYWREMNFIGNAVLLCLASEEYDEKDYIRDYGAFLKYRSDHEQV